MNSNELFYSLALNRIDGLGPVTFVRLLSHFGSAEKIFSLKKDELESFKILPKAISSLLAKDTFEKTEKEISYIEKNNIRVLSYTENSYPELLKQAESFPGLLYIKGEGNFNSAKDWLGIVGSRQVSEYGIKVCKKLVTELVSGGLGIVSGFALGVDITAHLSCIENNGKTLAVLGNGLGYVHPSSHKKHVEAILEKGGAFISEFPCDVPPMRFNFPRRNRVISGLSRGVLVIEAAEKSGALITAQYALDQNRDLFAVPGEITKLQSSGCNKLIQQGAKLITEGNDILKEWQYTLGSSIVEVKSLHPDEHEIYKALSDLPKIPDELIEATGFPSAKVLMLLTKLELDGKVRGLPGRRYERI